MEGPTTTAPALATAHPDRSFIWSVRAGCVAVLAVGIAVLVAVVSAGGGAPVPVGLLVLLPLLVLGATWNRGNVVEARVTGTGLDLVGRDGVVRSLPGGAIGGIGYAGAAAFGRLITVPVHWIPGTVGRIVVVDRSGRVLCARRAGWMRLDDLATLATAGGVPWIGSHARAVPGTTVPPPPEMAHVPEGPAGADPVVTAALARQRVSVRRVVLTTWALPFVATILFVIIANVELGPLGIVLGTIGGIAVGGFILGGPCVALWSSGAARQARRILKTASPWWPVEGVIAGGLVSNADARIVGIVHPASGEIVFWKAVWGGERGWLQGDDRSWFWFAPAAKGKRALLAPPDRSHVAVLEKTGLLDKMAQAEARSQVQAEAWQWQDQQAWAAAQHAPR